MKKEEKEKNIIRSESYLSLSYIRFQANHIRKLAKKAMKREDLTEDTLDAMQYSAENILKGIAKYKKIPPAKTDMDISTLNLSPRAVHCMHRGGITTIGGLTDWTAASLLNIRCLGNGTLQEIRAKLAEQGLSLKGE